MATSSFWLLCLFVLFYECAGFVPSSTGLSQTCQAGPVPCTGTNRCCSNFTLQGFDAIVDNSLFPFITVDFSTERSNGPAYPFSDAATFGIQVSVSQGPSQWETLKYDSESIFEMNSTVGSKTVVVNLLLDTSNSVTTAQLQTLKSSVLSFYRTVADAGLAVNLFWFSGDPTVCAPYAYCALDGDTEHQIEELSIDRHNGGTALNAALESILVNIYDKHKMECDYVNLFILFTDGHDTLGIPSNQHTIDAAREAASAGFLFAVGLQSPALDPGFLTALTRNHSVVAADIQSLETSFLELARRILPITATETTLYYCTPRANTPASSPPFYFNFFFDDCSSRASVPFSSVARKQMTLGECIVKMYGCQDVDHYRFDDATNRFQCLNGGTASWPMPWYYWVLIAFVILIRE